MADPTVHSIGDGWYIVDDGSTRWRVAVAGTKDDVWVFCGGRTWQVDTRVNAPSRKRASHGGDAAVMSPMPATVIAIRVSPGQAVTSGDTLLVLEAMKMELPIRSPRDGRVSAVRCSIGDLVQPGVSLLEFE